LAVDSLFQQVHNLVGVSMARTEITSTIFVVDDDASVRKALARLMKSAGYAVETFASASDFLENGRYQDCPGCVILDLRMPGLSGLDLQQELKLVTPTIPIIFITGHGDIPASVRAMKDGADDFLTKPVHAEILLQVVQQAVDRNRKDRAFDAELRELQRRAAALTPREHEVMALVVRGLLNKQVAAELGTVEKTIKVHRARVVEKMGVSSLAELVLLAERLGVSSQANTRTASRPAASAPIARRLTS
jgi:FixJ family two-component response regulator